MERGRLQGRHKVPERCAQREVHALLPDGAGKNPQSVLTMKRLRRTFPCEGLGFDAPVFCVL